MGAAFAQELLGMNHIRMRNVVYGPGGMSGLQIGDQPGAYSPEVRLIPQSEVNSYHFISSQAGVTWVPGSFVISFNGMKSLSGPVVAQVLHVNYYQLFCQLNAIEELCEPLIDEWCSP